MTRVIIYVVMQYDSTKFNWSAYTCFDKEINAEMTASSLNKNAKGYGEKFFDTFDYFYSISDEVIN